MGIRILGIGKTAEAYLREGESEYLKRLGRYVKVDYRLLPDVKKRYSEQELLKDAESELLMKQIKPGDYVVGLDERGEEYSSMAFSGFLDKQLSTDNSELVFLIGGAYGFGEEVRRRMNRKMALSRMTYSHQMVRLIFLEQLYRAFTILKNEPYHHEG
ncbi:MAG: 23S rRNA (pseudouridine(1915)-N(3))-methyltransferase RlmH [Flavobacteriales bacterium]|nr:23S rRNA (pseudouridine(1915)-N(3))-methyltransferase RlmH [Flavobacteriales bacterium]